MTCEESWPWDELLDSPASDSYQSASTTYDPPSVDSIPDSYDSSTGTWRFVWSLHILPCCTWTLTSSCWRLGVKSLQPIIVPPELDHIISGPFSFWACSDPSKLDRSPLGLHHFPPGLDQTLPNFCRLRHCSTGTTAVEAIEQ